MSVSATPGCMLMTVKPSSRVSRAMMTTSASHTPPSEQIKANGHLRLHDTSLSGVEGVARQQGAFWRVLQSPLPCQCSRDFHCASKMALSLATSNLKCISLRSCAAACRRLSAGEDSPSMLESLRWVILVSSKTSACLQHGKIANASVPLSCKQTATTLPLLARGHRSVPYENKHYPQLHHVPTQFVIFGKCLGHWSS